MSFVETSPKTLLCYYMYDFIVMHSYTPPALLGNSFRSLGKNNSKSLNMIGTKLHAVTEYFASTALSSLHSRRALVRALSNSRHWDSAIWALERKCSILWRARSSCSLYLSRCEQKRSFLRLITILLKKYNFPFCYSAGRVAARASLRIKFNCWASSFAFERGSCTAPSGV